MFFYKLLFQVAVCCYEFYFNLRPVIVVGDVGIVLLDDDFLGKL